MMTPEGQIISNDEISKFVCSWKYNENEQCSCENDNTACTPDSAMESNCREILKGKSDYGQWAYCHDWVDPQPFYQNCLTDLCNSNTKSTKCNAFASYTRACMVTQPYSLAYDKLCGISSHFNCDPKCGEGQMFKGCAKPCMDIGTCSNPPVDPATDMTGFQKCAMDKEKVSSCVCKPGTLFSTVTGKCITKQKCNEPVTTKLISTTKATTTKTVTYTVSVCKTTTVTKSGYKCARWDSNASYIRQYYNSWTKPYVDAGQPLNHNMCMMWSGQPWCYVTDSRKVWEWCDCGANDMVTKRP